MPAPTPEPAEAPVLDAAELRRACARFATGVCVAAVFDSDGLPRGLTVNSFTSVSAVPPMVLVCIDHRCSALPAFRNSSAFGISVLASSQRDVSIRFSRCGDRFDEEGWSLDPRSVPLLKSALATFECTVEQCLDAGDHTVFIGEVRKVTYRAGEPLIYFGSEYRSLLPGTSGS